MNISKTFNAFARSFVFALPLRVLGAFSAALVLAACAGGGGGGGSRAPAPAPAPDFSKLTPNENGVVLQWVNPTDKELGENEAIYSFTVNWRAVAPLSRSQLERIIRDDSAENASDSLARAVAQNATVSSILDADGDGVLLSYDEGADVFIGDNCRHVANANQSLDADGDGIGDACDDEDSLLRFIPGAETIRISWTNPAAGPPPLGSGRVELGPYPSETASLSAGGLTFSYDDEGNVTVSWTNPDSFVIDGNMTNITSFSVSLSGGAEGSLDYPAAAGENEMGALVSRPVLLNLSVTPAADTAYTFTVTATNSFNGSINPDLAIGSGCVIVASATTFASCGDTRPELPREVEEIGIESLLLIVEDGANGESIEEITLNASRFLAYGAAAHYVYNLTSPLSQTFRFSLNVSYDDGRNVTALVDDASSFAYSGAVASGPNYDGDHLADAADRDDDDDGIVDCMDGDDGDCGADPAVSGLHSMNSALRGSKTIEYLGGDSLANFESGGNGTYPIDWLQDNTYYTFSVEVGVREFAPAFVSTRGYLSISGAEPILLDEPIEKAAIKVAETKPDQAVLVGRNNDGDGLADAIDPDDDDDNLVDVIEVTFVHPNGVDCSLREDCDNDGVSDFDEVRGSALDETIGRGDRFTFPAPANASITLTRLCVVHPDCDADGVDDNEDAFQTDETENADTDGDLQGDNRDNCVTVANADQLNSDRDGRGDACEGGDFRGDPAVTDLLVRFGDRRDAFSAEYTNMTISWENHFYGDENELDKLNAELDGNMSLGVSDLSITEIALVVEQLNAANFSEVTSSYGREIYPDLASDSRIIEGEVTAEVTGERTTYQFSVDNEGYHNFTLTVTYGAEVNGTFNASITSGNLVADLVYVGLNTDGDDYADADPLETDDDNDGVLDENDAFPTDASESADTDGDREGNNRDDDDDNDMVLDVDELSFTNATGALVLCALLADCDGDGADDGEDAFPLDSAGDSDADGDGMADNKDGCPLLSAADDKDGCHGVADQAALSFSPSERGVLVSWRNVPAANLRDGSRPADFSSDAYRLTNATIRWTEVDQNGTMISAPLRTKLHLNLDENAALGAFRLSAGQNSYGRLLVGDFTHVLIAGLATDSFYNFTVSLLYANRTDTMIKARAALGFPGVTVGTGRNTDGDHLTDAEDADADNDGVANADERNFTNAADELVLCAFRVDCDGDDVPDGEDDAPTDARVQVDADGDLVDDVALPHNGGDIDPTDPLLSYDFDNDRVDDVRFDNCVPDFALSHLVSLGVTDLKDRIESGDNNAIVRNRNSDQANADGDILGDLCDQGPREGDTVLAPPGGVPLTISYYAGPENATENVTLANVTFEWATPERLYLPRAGDFPVTDLGDIVPVVLCKRLGDPRSDGMEDCQMDVNISSYNGTPGELNTYHATDLSNGTRYVFTIMGNGYEYTDFSGNPQTADVVIAEMEIETFSAPLTPVMDLEVVSSYDDMLVSWTIPDGDLTLVDFLNISLVEVEVDPQGMRTDEERLIYSKLLHNLNPKANKAALTDDNQLYDANGFISNHTIAVAAAMADGSAERGVLYDVVVTVHSILPDMVAGVEDAGGFYPDVANDAAYNAIEVRVEHSDDSFTLSWEAPPGPAALDQDEPRFREVTGFNLTDYRIAVARRNDPSDNFSRQVDSETFSSVFEDGADGIEDNILYDVAVVAVYVPPRTSDDERESQAAASNQPGLIHPQPAEVASATVTSGETIEVSWLEPSTITGGREDNGAEIADYYSVTNYEVILCNNTVDRCGTSIALASDTFSATIGTHMLVSLGLPDEATAFPAVYRVAVRTNYGGVDRNGDFVQLDPSFGLPAAVTGGYPQVIFYPSDSNLVDFRSELAPTSVAVSTESPGEVGVTWDLLELHDNYEDNGFSVAGYRVEACPFSGSRDACVASGLLSQNTASYRFEGDTVLLQGVEYAFTITLIFSDDRMSSVEIGVETTAQSELEIAEIQSGFDTVSFQWENSTVAIGGYRAELIDSSDAVVYTKTLRTEDLTAAIVTAGNVVHRINFDAPDADAGTALERGALYTIRIFTIPAIGEAGADPTGVSQSAVAFYPDVAVEEGYSVASVTVQHGTDAFIVDWAAPTAPLANAENFRRITGFGVQRYKIVLCRMMNSVDCDPNSSSVDANEARSARFPAGGFIEAGRRYFVNISAEYPTDGFGVGREAAGVGGDIPGLIYPAPAVATEIRATSGANIMVSWTAPEISESIRKFYGVDYYSVFLCPVGDANQANCRRRLRSATHAVFSSSLQSPDDREYEASVSVAYAATQIVGEGKQPIAGHVSAREPAAVQDESAYGVTDVNNDGQFNLIFYPRLHPEPAITAVTRLAGTPGSTSSTMTVEWTPPAFAAAHAANDYGVSQYIVLACIAGTDDCVSSEPLAATQRSWTFTAAAGDGAIKEGLSYVVNITTNYAHGDNSDGSGKATFNGGEPVAVPLTPIAEVTAVSGYDAVEFTWDSSASPIAGYIVRLHHDGTVLHTSALVGGGGGSFSYTVHYDDLTGVDRARLYDMEIYAVPLNTDITDPAEYINQRAAADSLGGPQYTAEDAYGFYPDVENDLAYRSLIAVESGSNAYTVSWQAPPAFDSPSAQLENFTGTTGFGVARYRVIVCEAGSSLMAGSGVTETPPPGCGTADFGAPASRRITHAFFIGDLVIEEGRLYNVTVEVIYPADDLGSPQRGARVAPQLGFIYPNPAVDAATIEVVSGEDIRVSWTPPSIRSELSSLYRIRNYDVTLCDLAGNGCPPPNLRVSSARTKFTAPSSINGEETPVIYVARILTRYELSDGTVADSNIAESIDTGLFFPTLLPAVAFGDPLFIDQGTSFSFSSITPPALHSDYGSEFEITGYAAKLCRGASSCETEEQSRNLATLEADLGFDLNVPADVQRGVDYWIEVTTTYTQGDATATASGRVEQIDLGSVSGIKAVFDVRDITPVDGLRTEPDELRISWEVPQNKEDISNYTLLLYGDSDISGDGILYANITTESNETREVSFVNGVGAGEVSFPRSNVDNPVYSVEILSNPENPGILAVSTRRLIGGFRPDDGDNGARINFALESSLRPRRITGVPSSNQYTYTLSWEAPSWEDANLANFISAAPNYDFVGYRLDINTNEKRFVSKDTLMVSLTFPEHLTFGDNFIRVAALYAYEMEDAIIVNATDTRNGFRFNLPKPSLPEIASVTAIPNFAAKSVTVDWVLDTPLSYPIDVANDVHAPEVSAFVKIVDGGVQGGRTFALAQSQTSGTAEFSGLNPGVVYFAEVTLGGIFLFRGADLEQTSMVSPTFGFDPDSHQPVQSLVAAPSATNLELEVTWAKPDLTSLQAFIEATSYGLTGYDVYVCAALSLADCVGPQAVAGADTLTTTITPSPEGIQYDTDYYVAVVANYNSTDPFSSQILSSAAVFHSQSVPLSLPLPDPSETVDSDGDSIRDVTDLDDDGDGLIEIWTADMLHNVRYVLNGTGYRASAAAAVSDLGCGGQDGVTECSGYELGADISLAAYTDYEGGKGWLPLGHDTDPDDDECQGESFSALFDGNGMTVSDLTIARADEDCVGLFGQIGEPARIRNLRIKADSVNGNDRVGGLTGDTGTSNIVGIIANSSVHIGAVNGNDWVGGLVGDGSFGTITDSSAVVGSVNGNENVGGLIGSGTTAIITNASAVVGSVNGNEDVGGLIGDGRLANITDSSVVVGSVNGSNSVGGLIGIVGRDRILERESSMLANSFSLVGSVNGNEDVGGLIGWVEGAIRIANSFSVVGSVNGSNNVGGLTGRIPTSSIIMDSYAVAGSVNGSLRVGGLIGAGGTGGSSNTITNSYAVSGSVNGSEDVGGLLGVGVNRFGFKAVISVSYWDSDISGITAGSSGAPQTTHALRSPTSAVGIYEDWARDECGWDFGDSNQYPALLCMPVSPEKQRSFYSVSGGSVSITLPQ